KRVAAIVKPCFLPEEGHVWVDADMASFEVRVFAHLAADPTVLDAYRQNPELDFHQFVADLTNLPRNASYNGEANAKQLNLAMIFNSGNGHTADMMGMPWEWSEFTTREGEHVRYQKAGPEAMEVIETYHRKLPGVRALAAGAERKAKNRGYVFTQYGRRLRFPRGWKSYKASGLLIQATSADINKENIQLTTDVLGGEGRLLLNTHDSYSMSLPEDSWRSKFNAVKRAIERPVLDVPLMLELSGTGRNWAKALGL
ncbi:MAG: DNA polymerase I, partial [Gammaproteobacteria bacterium]